MAISGIMLGGIADGLEQGQKLIQNIQKLQMEQTRELRSRELEMRALRAHEEAQRSLAQHREGTLDLQRETLDFRKAAAEADRASEERAAQVSAWSEALGSLVEAEREARERVFRLRSLGSPEGSKVLQMELAQIDQFRTMIDGLMGVIGQAGEGFGHDLSVVSELTRMGMPGIGAAQAPQQGPQAPTGAKPPPADEAPVQGPQETPDDISPAEPPQAAQGTPAASQEGVTQDETGRGPGVEVVGSESEAELIRERQEKFQKQFPLAGVETNLVVSRESQAESRRDTAKADAETIENRRKGAAAAMPDFSKNVTPVKLSELEQTSFVDKEGKTIKLQGFDLIDPPETMEGEVQLFTDVAKWFQDNQNTSAAQLIDSAYIHHVDQRLLPSFTAPSARDSSEVVVNYFSETYNPELAEGLQALKERIATLFGNEGGQAGVDIRTDPEPEEVVAHYTTEIISRPDDRDDIDTQFIAMTGDFDEDTLGDRAKVAMREAFVAREAPSSGTNLPNAFSSAIRRIIGEDMYRDALVQISKASIEKREGADRAMKAFEESFRTIGETLFPPLFPGR